MDSKNPNLDTTNNNHSNVLSSPSSSSQDFKKTNLQHNGLSKFHEDNQGFIFKNAYNEGIKKPTFVSSSSLAAGEAHIKPSSPPPPPSSPPPPSRQDFKKTHQEDKIYVSKKMEGNKGLNFGNPNCEMIKKPNYDHVLSCYSPGEGNMATPPPVPPPEVAGLVEGESGRERLNRHRVEMAGRVRIPDIWGHEDLLKDWIDCSVFDASLGNKTIMSARAALVQEGRSTRRIENQYC